MLIPGFICVLTNSNIIGFVFASLSEKTINSGNMYFVRTIEKVLRKKNVISMLCFGCSDSQDGNFGFT